MPKGSSMLLPLHVLCNALCRYVTALRIPPLSLSESLLPFGIRVVLLSVFFVVRDLVSPVNTPNSAAIVSQCSAVTIRCFEYFDRRSHRFNRQVRASGDSRRRCLYHPIGPRHRKHRNENYANVGVGQP